ncbi:MAG TPA: EpsG family protein [Allosphingosinicella sp.]
MFPYWLLFALFAAGAIQYSRADRQARVTSAGQLDQEGRRSLMLGVVGALAAVMIGFRYQTGGDWEPYLYIFEEMSQLEFATMLAHDDPGYNILNWVVHQLGFTIWAVNLVCAALFAFGLVKFANHQPNPWLAVVVAVPYLIIVVGMGYTRQAVAIGLIMAAIVAWDRGTLVKFGLYILIATTFHKTAVLALPLIALSATKNRFLTGIVGLVFGFILYRYFLSESVDRMMQVYVEAEYSSQGAAIRVAMNFVPAAIFLGFQKRFQLSENQRRMWRYFSLTAMLTVVMLMVLPSSTAVDRIALYLIPLQLFVFSRLPEAFTQDGKPNQQMMAFVLAYSALIQFVWLNYANHAEYWVPYKFWPITEEAETTPQEIF